MKQWFLRITSYKERLLNDLDSLSHDKRWPDRVLSMQRNWLGRSEGARIKFPIVRSEQGGEDESIEVFTTRPDTLFGVQYLALSLNYPLVLKIAEENQALRAFIESAASLPAGSKDGYLLPQICCQNPLSLIKNLPKEVYNNLPVYAAPYVLGDYGEGAVMGVPGHDRRDHAFWKYNRGDEAIRKVVGPSRTKQNTHTKIDSNEKTADVFEKSGVLNSFCGEFAGFKSSEASAEIIKILEKTANLARLVENWKLRDWLISRQRYWGTPIPIIHCQSCGAVPVPVEKLPVLLPKLEGNWSQDKKGNPIESAQDWLRTSCPKCGRDAKRETDTMDTFMDSSWYFMRFADSDNTDQPFSPEAAEAYLPVDIYVGGVEHAILHLLYARFISKVFSDAGFWPSGGGPDNNAEPFRRLISQGMVHGKTFSDPETGRFLKPEEIDLRDPSDPKINLDGKSPNVSWQKMSKSKHNGVDPTVCIERYGADATRAHILFQAPVSEVLEWEEERIVGIQRWFGRVWRLTQKIQPLLPHLPNSSDPIVKFPSSTPLSNSSSIEVEAELCIRLQQTITSVTTSLSETYALNTVISDLMELTNSLESNLLFVSLTIKYHILHALLRMLAPIAPAFAEECWETLHAPHRSDSPLTPSPLAYSSIFTHPFPTPTPTPDYPLAALQPRWQTCVIQENGKLRLTLKIAPPSSEALLRTGNDEALRTWILEQIAAIPEGAKWMETSRAKRGPWTRVVVVKEGRVVNFVR